MLNNTYEEGKNDNPKEMIIPGKMKMIIPEKQKMKELIKFNLH